MTPLADLLIRRIRATGPITLAEYMADCLLHPEHGYYSTRDPFGAAGDFITAPEISARCLANCWACVWRKAGLIKDRPPALPWPSLAPVVAP